ncbi:MAG: hypothetical protein GWO22_38040, partial [Actinobacteria bacterium]|nr:hypothetical protein [Actinomycetota bacterium]
MTAGETVTVSLLGLLPDTDYVARVIAFGTRVVAGAPVSFRTGPLPEDLPAFTAGGSDPSPGYVVVAAG